MVTTTFNSQAPVPKGTILLWLLRMFFLAGLFVVMITTFGITGQNLAKIINKRDTGGPVAPKSGPEHPKDIHKTEDGQVSDGGEQEEAKKVLEGAKSAQKQVNDKKLKATTTVKPRIVKDSIRDRTGPRIISDEDDLDDDEHEKSRRRKRQAEREKLNPGFKRVEPRAEL